MAELFQKDVRTINEHLLNLFNDGELDPERTIRKLRIVRQEGNRQVSGSGSDRVSCTHMMRPAHGCSVPYQVQLHPFCRTGSKRGAILHEAAAVSFTLLAPPGCEPRVARPACPVRHAVRVGWDGGNANGRTT
jgi:hypothetical protein